jgi:hypothetical protein
VEWLLTYGCRGADLSHLRESIGSLQVVDHCHCGCGSIDFIMGGRAAGYTPIAEGLGTDAQRRALRRGSSHAEGSAAAAAASNAGSD